MKFLMAIPALALVLTACGSTGYDYEDDYSDEYVPVCIDSQTNQRLEDDACEQGDDDFLMTAILVYMLASDYPAVGHKAKHYKTKKPSGVTLTKPLKKGYKIPKTSSGSGYKPKSGGSGYKPKSSGGGFKSGGGSSFKSSRR